MMRMTRKPTYWMRFRMSDLLAYVTTALLAISVGGVLVVAILTRLLALLAWLHKAR